MSGGSSNFRAANRFLRRELDKCADETAAPDGRLARLGRDLKTVAYLARNGKFDSIPLSVANPLRTDFSRGGAEQQKKTS